MLAWLDTLTLIERILLYIAIPATLLLLIQTLLLFVGLGGEHEATADSPEGGDLLDLSADHELSLDLDGDGVPDLPDDLDLHDGDMHCEVCGETHEVDAHHTGDHHGEGTAGGLHILTLRGVVAFFTLFGWSGLLLCQVGLHWLPAVFFAVQIGIIGMVVVAFIMREALKLQSDGTLNIRNALGQTGSVYLTVPPGRSGEGKVNVVVQEQMREFEAMTDETEPIHTGADITVVGILNGDILMVKSL